MNGFSNNIEQLTTDNRNFREVLYTGTHMQLVLMCLKPGEEIGSEVHDDGDQFFRFEAGEGVVTVDDNQYEVADGDSVVVPAGAKHNVRNTSDNVDLQLYTIYAPPHHKDGTTHASRDQALADEEHFDGVTSE